MRAEFNEPLKCCEGQVLSAFDYEGGLFEESFTPVVHRFCHKCRTHWYGPSHGGKKFSRKEWDEWVNEEGGE